MLNKEKVKLLIEPHFRHELRDETYKIKTIKAHTLLTSTRFDLAFKLLYLEMLEYDVEFAKEIYKEHINAFSLGKFIEPGNEDKNSIQKYIDDFKTIFESIKKQGFDKDKTLIPLSENGTIANGAHRVASAIFLNRSLSCVEVSSAEHIYDYQFFYNRNIPQNTLDTGATTFIEYAENVYIALVWPTAIGNEDEIAMTIPNIVYQKDVHLNINGAHNLLSQIYRGENWIGSTENNFKGVRDKLAECFKSENPVRVIAFQAENLSAVLQIKEKIRDMFSVGKHSIHISDTKKEAIDISRLLFNNNSIHFLNYAKPNTYTTVHRQVDQFKNFIQLNKINPKGVLIDSSMILSLYGLREAKDIDYFALDNKQIEHTCNGISMHDEDLIHHKLDKNELILNPKYYFYFNDIKFISFNQLYIMKKRRAEPKDLNDCNIMEALIENDLLKETFNKVKQSIYYGKIKLRQNLVNGLKKIKLYDLAKYIYMQIKVKQ